MRKSISKRIKITKTGKVLRRAMALGHARSNKRSVQMMRKKRSRGLYIDLKKIKSYLNQRITNSLRING